MFDPPDVETGMLLARAWPLPRFQPDPALAECAAQVAVIANSTLGGAGRLTANGPKDDFPSKNQVG